MPSQAGTQFHSGNRFANWFPAFLFIQKVAISLRRDEQT
jgi:hypothetical protein